MSVSTKSGPFLTPSVIPRSACECTVSDLLASDALVPPLERLLTAGDGDRRVVWPAASSIAEDIDQAQDLGLPARPVVGVAHADQSSTQVLGTDVDPNLSRRGSALQQFPHGS